MGAAAANRGGRVNKRRRLDDAPDDAATEPFDQHWDEDARQGQQQQSQSYVSGQDAPSFSTAAAAANNALGATEGSSWPTNTSSDASAYPDLATYQQQPYFYGQSGTGVGTYNSSWSATATQPYGDTSTSVSYSVGDQASTTTMPFFPPSNSNNVGDTTETLEGNNSFNYPDVEVANQYANYTAPSATAQLAQREAAKSSAYYFDDASMHLKIQSLPILDNLVRVFAKVKSQMTAN